MLSRTFRLTGVSVSIFALTFLLMQPVTQIDEPIGNVCVVALGLVFWGSLLMALYFTVKLIRQSKAVCSQDSVRCPKSPTAFRFFSNRKAVWADILLLVCAAYAAAVFILQPEMQYLFLLALGLLVFSFGLHCLFNSNAYIVIHTASKYKMCKERRR